jgi:Ribonuclease G/E
MIRLHAAISPGEIRVAAWDGARLHDVAISRPAAPDGVGDLHRGRVIARVRAMAGCFVALEGGVEGFLPDSEGAEDEGAVLGVRVARAAQGGKGPRLSAKLASDDRALIGAGAPALLRRGPDALARMAEAYPDAPILIDDAAAAAASPRKAELATRAFSDALEEAWDALASSDAALPGGARMTVHPTPALVAIDVDLGAAAAQRGSKTHVQGEANRALIPELCRQIRLRNLSGAILVDLGGMAQKKRPSLAPDFARALAIDPLKPRLLGFTQLGLAEIVRPRVYPPLHEVLATPHALGLAALRRLVREAETLPHRAFCLHASAEIATALATDSAAAGQVFARTGRALEVIEHRDWPGGRCRIEEKTHG